MSRWKRDQQSSIMMMNITFNSCWSLWEQMKNGSQEKHCFIIKKILKVVNCCCCYVDSMSYVVSCESKVWWLRPSETKNAFPFLCWNHFHHIQLWKQNKLNNLNIHTIRNETEFQIFPNENFTSNGNAKNTHIKKENEESLMRVNINFRLETPQIKE